VSTLFEVRLPTGEPYAGNPPVRFGGRGSREALPTPITRSPQRELWVRVQRKPKARIAGGIKFSVPEISLVVINPMLVQQGHQFLFIAEFSMVFFLAVDVIHDLVHIGFAYAECSIPELPGKSRPLWPLLMHPFAGIGFDKAKRIRNGNCGRQTDQKVHMILHAINGQRFAFKFACQAAEIGMKFRLQLRNNRSRSLFRAEDEM